MYYLKGLNTLRFIAAMLVLIYHCNDGLRQIDNELLSFNPLLLKGSNAVDFFFILSGFLLSYLACIEYSKTDKIDIKKFFLRRVFRIFPLYYLAVLGGLFLTGVLFPMIYGQAFLSFPLGEGLLYYMLFLPNYVIVNWDQIGPTYSLWSIGVEEQFYLFFPFLMLFVFRFKNILGLIFIFLLCYTAFYFSVYFQVIHIPEPFYALIIETLRFHFILFGVFLGALLYINPESAFFKVIGNNIIQVLVLLAFVVYLLFVRQHLDPHNIIGGLLFSLTMLVVSHKKALVNLEIKPFVYLGTISYGIYVFHPFVSILLRFVMEKIAWLNELILFLPFSFYLIVSLLTIGIAHFSYTYYESWFLKKKKKYAVIK